MQEKILLEQSRSVKDILTLKWLKENEQVIIDKINECVLESNDWNGDQMMDIERIEDLVSKGNGFYSFIIFNIEDGIEKQWYVEANYKNSELQIDDIMIYA